METLTFGIAELSQLKRGDRITLIDGKAVGPFTVKGKASTRVIPCKSDGRPVEVNIYPQTNIEKTITVERVKRVQRRTIHGVTLVNDQGIWRTPDGRFEVSYAEQGWTECERPHPIRTGRHTGEYCPGGVMHEYHGWQAWDVTLSGGYGDYVDGARGVGSSMSDVVLDIAHALQREQVG